MPSVITAVSEKVLCQIILSRFEIDNAVMLCDKLSGYGIEIVEQFVVKFELMGSDDIILADFDGKLEDKLRDIILEVMKDRLDRLADDGRDVIYALPLYIIAEVLIYRFTH